MRHRLFYHLTWTTRMRLPTIDSKLATFLGRYLPAAAAQEGARILELGIVRTHVHVLLAADQMTELARLVQRLKGASSAIATKEQHAQHPAFGWAKGYSLETVSPRAVPAVRDYIRNQPRRHPRDAIAEWQWRETPPLSQPGAEPTLTL